MSEIVRIGTSTQRDKLLGAVLALPFGGDALDGLGALCQGRADEVTNEAVEVGVLASRFLFKQVEDLIRHLPLH